MYKIVFILFILLISCQPQVQEITINKSRTKKLNIDEKIPSYGIVAFTKDEKKFIVTNTLERKIFILNEELRILKTVGGSGKGPNQFDNKISTVVKNPINNKYYVGSFNNSIWIYDSSFANSKSIKLYFNTRSSSPNQPFSRTLVFYKDTLITGTIFYGKFCTDSVTVAAKFNSSGQHIGDIKVDSKILHIDRGGAFAGSVENSFVRLFGEDLIISFKTNNVIVIYDLINKKLRLIKNLASDYYFQPFWKDNSIYRYFLVGSNSIARDNEYIYYFEPYQKALSKLRIFIYRNGKHIATFFWNIDDIKMGNVPSIFVPEIIDNKLFCFDINSSVEGIYSLNIKDLIR